MENYTDYNFYENTYEGNMPEDDFDRLVTRASYEVRKNIFNRDITGYENEVQLATCSIADILLKIEQMEQKKSKLVSNDKSDKIIANEKVADLSITYANTNNLKELEQEISSQKTKIQEEIVNYLLLTGLLNRRINLGRII